MRIRLLAVILAVFAFCGVASAQAYFIRAESRNNLRSCAGFNCRVVETAPIGTVLEVIGEYNRWLKINRNGEEVWMANWIDYSRVEPGEQTSAPLPSDVDNCCFVDRQCGSDEEWTSGFWAFQNNQCAAPAASLPQTLPPASVDPSQIDNCCFLDWLCVTDDDWQSGFQAFQNNQCKHPGVAIEGSEDFIAWMEASLDMLKDGAPQWYDYVISGLDKIEMIPEGPGQFSGIIIDTRTYVKPSEHNFVTTFWHVVHQAGAMVHEACHSHRHDAGFPYGPSAEVIIREERACVEVQLEVTEALDPFDRTGLGSWLQDIIENIENPEYWWW